MNDTLMMRISKEFHRTQAVVLLGLLATTVVFRASTADDAAAPPSIPAVVERLAKDKLAQLEGKTLTILRVEYPPNGSSAPHSHDGDVYVYVLEGSLIMQIDGSESVRLEPGDLFIERPGDVHRHSANVSDKHSATFLAILVQDSDAPASRAIADGVHR